MPIAEVVAHRLGVTVPFAIPIWFWLPNSICPHIQAWIGVLSSPEVVPLAFVSSTEHTVPGPRGVLRAIEAERLVWLIQTVVSSPLRFARTVRYAFRLVGAKRNVHVRALIIEYILHATPTRAVPSVLRPYERLRCFHIMELPTVLMPSPQASIPNILTWVVSQFSRTIYKVRKSRLRISHGVKNVVKRLFPWRKVSYLWRWTTVFVETMLSVVC